MKYKYRLLGLVFALLLPLLSSGQEDLISTHYHQFDVQDQKVSYRQYTSTSNEANQIFSALFLIYKEFISSQDVDACVFTPSCSVYAMESIKEYGILIGICSALDRLTRCHGFAAGDYSIHPHTHKNYDPVEKKD
ncbi:MAG: membrane protein insertion efficiency factor YidD [Bacteroidales bacterium]|nr:membrane protein insertion efficiency factor YidD [Bacteroidales bacterium]